MAIEQNVILVKIKKQKWFLILFSVFFTGLVTVYILTLPDIFQAKTLIAFPQRLPSMGGGGMMEALSGGGAAPIKMFTELLTSDRVFDYVASHSGVKRKELKSKLSIRDQRMSNTMLLLVEDEIPIKAQKISRLLVSQLKELNTELNIPSTESDYKQIMKDLETKSDDLAVMEQKLQAFIEKAKTAPTSAITKEGFFPGGKWLEQQKSFQTELNMTEASIDKIKSQMKAQSGNNSELPSKIYPLQEWRNILSKLEYDLKTKEIKFGPEAPEIVYLKDQIEITRGQLNKETQKYVDSSDKGITAELSELVSKKAGLVAALNNINEMVTLVPKEAMEYQRLTREMGILNSIVQQLRQQSEVLKMSTGRDPNKWNVIDDASIMGPVNKSLIKPLAIGIFGSILLGIPLVIWRERPRKLKSYT